MCRGNAVKYLVRAGNKNPDTLLEDLEKAKWFVEREIARVKRKRGTDTGHEPLVLLEAIDTNSGKSSFVPLSSMATNDRDVLYNATRTSD